MASPSLKIKLRLSGPKPVESSQPSPTGSTASLKSVHVRDEDASSIESPRKKSKPNSNQSRKPKVETMSILETPVTREEDTGEETSNNSNRRGGGGPGLAAIINNNAQAVKELLQYKHIKTRKWATKPLVFYTLTGSEVELPSWQSEEKRKLNKQSTEPRTVAEIDLLFTSTANEARPFLCTHAGCSKAFTSYDQLQTHETNIHGAKKLVCGIDGCHKSFATSGQLTKHQKMVHFRAARKAKLATEAAIVAAGDNMDKEEDMSTPFTFNGGNTDSVDISNS